VNAPQSHFTLREWAQHMGAPARVVALMGTTVILAIIGPFDSMGGLPLIVRFFYWGLLVWIGYSIGYAADAVVRRWVGQDKSWPIKALISGGLTGCGIFILVLLLNLGFLGAWDDRSLIGVIAVNAFAISYVISGALQYLGQTTHTAPTATVTAPAILDRIPFEKRGTLVSLSVEDHYVRVVTSKGQDMILMRLGDAIRETAPAKGMQIHRSPWVALDRIASVKRIKDRAELTTDLGQTYPVSRTYVPHLKKAGFL